MAESKLKQQSSDVLQTGWIPIIGTLVYSSVDDPTGILTIAGDKTAIFTVGTRLRFVNGGNTIYGIVSKAPSYSAPNTTITFCHEIDPSDSLALTLMANSAITAAYYSRVAWPAGFPMERTKWRVKVTDISSRTQASPTQNVWYNLGSLNIVIPIGFSRTWYKVFVNAFESAGTDNAQHSTLSTANNSESDADFTAQTENSGASGVLVIGCTHFVEKSLAPLTSKTTYYINSKTKNASQNNITFSNNQVGMVIVSELGYL